MLVKNVNLSPASAKWPQEPLDKYVRMLQDFAFPSNRTYSPKAKNVDFVLSKSQNTNWLKGVYVPNLHYEFRITKRWTQFQRKCRNGWSSHVLGSLLYLMHKGPTIMVYLGIGRSPNLVTHAQISVDACARIGLMVLGSCGLADELSIEISTDLLWKLQPVRVLTPSCSKP